MRTLIVPCAGRNFINNRPRWSLACYNNEILLSLCLKRICIDNFDRIIVTILRDDLSFFDVEQLRDTIDKKIEFCILEKPTVGPADTIYETLVDKNVKGSICIKDIDIVFEYPKNASGNFISGIHLLNYNSNLRNARSKSFITKNEKDIVMDIIEKNVKSDIISIGLYGFENANDFIRAYKDLKESVENEERLFVSHIITYLIGVDNKVFDFVEIPNYELFETESDYDKAIKSRGTYIINTKSINVCEQIEKFKLLSQKGASIIFVVSSLNVKEIEKIVYEAHIKCSFLVSDSKDCFIKYIESEEELKEVFFNVI